MTEKEKRDLGMWYDANYDKELIKERYQAMDLLFELNRIKPSDEEKRKEIIMRLIGNCPEGLTILSPFTCDYGTNISLGHDVFVNSSCYFMDCAKITIGNHVFIGPYCGFYTANHPLDYKRRNIGLEQALPITVKDNVWFGANVSVMPGVTIGEGCVIAAGSVVTKDIPANSLAAGIPCRVIKTIDND